MANINLLPWREHRREAQKRQFMGMLGVGAVGSIFLMLVIHLAIGSEISAQNYVNTYLQQTIHQVDGDIEQINKLKQERNEMIAKLKVIQALQGNRPLTVHIFDELPKILPKGIYLTGVAREGMTITLEGSAESNTRVSELMRNIATSPWLDQPVLMEIKTGSSNTDLVNHFKLQMQENEESSMPTESKSTGTSKSNLNNQQKIPATTSSTPSPAGQNPQSVQTKPAATNTAPQSAPIKPAAANAPAPATPAATPPLPVRTVTPRGGPQP